MLCVASAYILILKPVHPFQDLINFMCGIVSFYQYKSNEQKIDPKELRKIRDYMLSRGPDGVGEWFSEDGRVGLGHRRLSIIDLSDRASQPMQSQDGSVQIVFNGEIYNYKELKLELQKKGRKFLSDSDTEVLIHLYQERGEKMFPALRGMFALAIWDKSKKGLLLARDPYGIKPLYYNDNGSYIRVASQVKALLAGGNVSKAQSPEGIVGFFLTGSIPDPYTIFKSIKAVPAGSSIWIDANGASDPKHYFSISQTYREAYKNLILQPDYSEAENLKLAHEALLDSIRRHFIADVKVGVFLSSGMDSGILVALAHEAEIKGLTTITLGFEAYRGTQKDEVAVAEEVARLYKTTHYTKIITKADFENEIFNIFKIMDQPSIDGVNTYFVSKAAKEIGIKVALSGLGGDELFGGYPSFAQIPNIVKWVSLASRTSLVQPLCRKLISLARRWKPSLSPKYSSLMEFGNSYAGAYFLRRGLFMPSEIPLLIDPDLARLGLKHLGLLSLIEGTLAPDPINDFARVSTLETSLYMRNQLLRDADWAGMANSMEIRIPYGDSHLLKNLAKILISHLSFNKKKWLAQSLSLPLPRNVIQSAKKGFAVPIEKWLESNVYLDAWRSVPLLAKSFNKPSRRWAYTLFTIMQKEFS